MKRRSFLGSLTAMASMFCMNVGFSSGSKMTGVQKNGFFEVKGSPEDCKAFAEAFQTNLWPEWRTHSNDVARRVMRQCESLHQTGCARVSSHGKQLEEALCKTLNQFACKMRPAFPSAVAALVIAFALLCSGTASAQCENGVCLLPRVASAAQAVVSMPVRLVTSVAPVAMAGEDCGCGGQCGQPGCTCAPQSAPAVSSSAVPMRTPVRTILRAPLRARPFQRLFRCR